MADQIWPNGSRLLDANGDPLSGAKVYAYESGTATLLTTYTDDTLTVANANPVLTDAQGLIPPLWHDGSVDVKVNATDADDVVLNGFPIDPAPSFKGGSAANDISFTATPDVPANSVQEAIEYVGEEVTDLEGRNLAGLVPITSATADDTTSIVFTAFDQAEYRGYKFVLQNVIPVTSGTNFGVTLSTDGGTTFITVDNKWGGVEADASGTITGRGSTASSQIVVARQAQVGAGGVNGEVTMFSPDENSRTHVTFLTSYQSGNATGFSGAGRTDAASVVNAIKFNFASGNISSGTITMYGLAR